MREEYIISKTQLLDIEYEENLEDQFYFTLQDMLSSNLIQEEKLLAPLKTVVDKNGNIISMIQIENIQGNEVVISKDFEYFQDDLLAAIRERKNGIIIKEILFGNILVQS